MKLEIRRLEYMKYLKRLNRKKRNLKRSGTHWTVSHPLLLLCSQQPILLLPHYLFLSNPYPSLLLHYLFLSNPCPFLPLQYPKQPPPLLFTLHPSLLPLPPSLSPLSSSDTPSFPCTSSCSFYTSALPPYYLPNTPSFLRSIIY